MRGLALIMAVVGIWMLVVPGRRSSPAAPPSPRRIITSAGSALAGLMVGIVLTGSLYPSIGIGAIAAFVPNAMTTHRHTRDRERIASAWPETLSVVRARLGSGASIRDSFAGAVADNPTLSHWATDLAGIDFEAALNAFGAAIDDPLTDRVVATIGVAHRVGGSRTGTIIGNLADSVADEVRVRRAHDAAVTEQRLTSLAALVAPWGLLLLTTATNTQAAEIYASTNGAVIVAIGLAATTCGYLLTRRALQLTRMPRAFR
ncbi:MAG: hypothetical protein HKN01_05445 [Acidimicrobiia bacterium]|nr:hypothetical protein [Acidimicrobiia bacterium]NNF69197.1 hypothetical protein [Acidimicrobiia bacterium]